MTDVPRRRGRPTNAERDARRAAESTDPGYVSVEVTGAGGGGSGGGMTARQAETKARRRRRDDSGETLNRKLYIPERFKDPNYEYRWINDTAAGRIQDKTVFDDWDVVTADMMGPEYRVAAQSKDNSDNTAVRRVVGSENGQPLYAYFCRKPKEFYNEDQAKKVASIRATEEAMRRGPLPSDQGLGEGEAYVPRDHRNVIAGR